MSKQEVFDFINKCIVSEYGKPIGVNDLLIDSELDSLGMTLVLLQVNSKFNIFMDMPKDQSEFDYLGIPTLTMRGLIAKCVLSSTSAFTERKS